MNTCASKWTRNGKLKLKLVRPEKKIRVYDAQTPKNANPGCKMLGKGGWIGFVMEFVNKINCLVFYALPANRP